VGSRLIGQNWNGQQWFQGRPAATTAADREDITKGGPAPYNAADSTGSKLGPANGRLFERLVGDPASPPDRPPELANRDLPADMLTASVSGLDPDISPANAALQASAGRAGARRRNGGHRSTCSAPRDTSPVRDFR